MIGRAWLIALAGTFFVLIFMLRLVHLQIIRGDRYASMIEEDRLVTDFKPARRGRILDRHGSVIVDNRAVYHLAVVLAQLETSKRQQRQTPFYTLSQDGLDAF